MEGNEVLTILGRGDSWELCPFEGEIWAAASVLTDPRMSNRHYDKVFAFDYVSEVKELEGMLVVARERSIPIVSIREYATEKYPLLEVFNEFKSTFLRNTISYMLALAIYRGYKDIRIYGVDQEDEIRYQLTRPYVVFWLGVAIGRGVKYTIANRSFPSYADAGFQGVLDKIFLPKVSKEVGHGTD